MAAENDMNVFTSEIDTFKELKQIDPTYDV